MIFYTTFVNFWNVKGCTHQILELHKSCKAEVSDLLESAIIELEDSISDKSPTKVIYCNNIDQLLQRVKKLLIDYLWSS